MTDERALIGRILGESRLGTPGDGTPGAGFRLGPGDDAGVLGRFDGDLVISTDLSIEGVHFRLGWISAAEAGARAMAAALSDLAAMGAHPRAVLLSIAGQSPDAVAEAGAAAGAFAQSMGIGLLGGDVSRAPVLVMDVVVVGETSAPLTRSGAGVDQEVWVTGHLGAPAAALDAWRSGNTPPAEIRSRFVSPFPRIREIEWLRDHAEITAAIDISDGLLQDAGQLARGSELRMDLNSGDVPIHPAVVANTSTDQALPFALHGGEEYEILLTSPGIGDDIVGEFAERFGIPLTRVGRTAVGSGVTLDGVVTDTAGFDHFRTAE